MSKEAAKQLLAGLIDRYNRTLRFEDHAYISEETIRTWLNEFLAIFGWDVQDPAQILQERVLRGVQRERLREIHSPHRRPDYTFRNGANIKSFLDAKALDTDIFSDAETAYQIRSYGWSAQAPCAFVSNFEQFVIFDTRFVPDPGQPAGAGAIQLHIDSYLDQFDILYDHLWRDNICRNRLEELYAVTATEGQHRVDAQFMAVLSSFRKKLACNLVRNNPAAVRSGDVLNYYVQVILDRIVFIRVCESKGIEEQQKLKTLADAPEGFWNAFKAGCRAEFHHHYGGAMFPRDDVFQSLQFDNAGFVDFINQLYYPFPYRFDIIPVKVLANIYEEFLGTQMVLDGGTVREISKEEYIRSNGAIATPEHIVDMVCKQTLALETVRDIDTLLGTTVLDPCCGSGIFAVSCYEFLAEKMLAILSGDAEERRRHPDFYCMSDGRMLLTIAGRRAVASRCICAVDCDEAAVEVTKMSLALKILDGNDPLAWESAGAFGADILGQTGDNIKLGNTLVEDGRAFSAELVADIKPLDIRAAFPAVFAEKGGFDYVVGNPPYVETKYYKAAQPAMHLYLSGAYSSFAGKADLAVLFIERGLHLLNACGRLGFIIQRRWFRTEYGSVARQVINDGKYLEKLIDFAATDIFAGRIVYASIMVLSKGGSEALQYYYMPSDAAGMKVRFENSSDSGGFEGCRFERIPCQTGTAPWLFDRFAIASIRTRLSERFGNLRDYPRLVIKDGIQALWKKAYHLKAVQIMDGIAVGRNGFQEPVAVEAEVLRGVIYNRLFYPFKDVEPDAWCIFPYEGASAKPVPFSEMRQRYPLAYEYLARHENRIKESVRCRPGDLWHTFTREHNHGMYDVDKIIIPMTARDTIATFITGRGLYMDNANVWFLAVPGADRAVMKAITCVINSSAFSVLGKAGANPQSGGYFKFNKQFLAPIPFPSEKITPGGEFTGQLAALYDRIFALQNQYLAAPPVRREVIAQTLEQSWEELDGICYELYEVTGEERRMMGAVGRTVSRAELLNGVNR